MLPLLLTLVMQCPDGTPPPCRGIRAASAPPTSVAVLDFENRSRDTSDAFLAEGLADEISTRLGQVGRLTVVSRSQVRRLTGSSSNGIPALGRALNSATPPPNKPAMAFVNRDGSDREQAIVFMN